MFNKWLDLTKVIIDNISNQPHLVCPTCGRSEVDYQYVGDSIKKIGYLDVWCNSCLNGIHLSRVKIPEGANMLTFEMPIERISERIPNFQQITPRYK